MANFEARRKRLGDRLRALRVDAGFEQGATFAQRIGWNAPKVSKVENGRQSVSVEDLDAWLAAVDASPEIAEQLRAELAMISDEYITWKAAVRAGHRARQEESVIREAKAARIRAVDVGIVPGLIQTADYARHTLEKHAALHGGGHDIAEAVQARMRRQQVLYASGKQIELLIAGSALAHPIAPPDVMIGQVHRVLDTLGIATVRVGLLPIDVELPYPLTHGYWIVDNLVQIETTTAELTITEPDEVATYEQLTDMLWEQAAVEGGEAAELLRQYLDELQGGGPPRRRGGRRRRGD